MKSFIRIFNKRSQNLIISAAILPSLGSIGSVYAILTLNSFILPHLLPCPLRRKLFIA